MRRTKGGVNGEQGEVWRARGVRWVEGEGEEEEVWKVK